MKKTIVYGAVLSAILLLSVPTQVSAAACAVSSDCSSGQTCSLGTCVAGGSGSLDSFSGTIIGFIDTTLVPLIFAIAFIVFLWGVFKYFIAGGASDEKQKEGRTFIMYAIIGFVLMFSLWGIVRLFTNSLGFDSDTRPPTPTFGS